MMTLRILIPIFLFTGYALGQGDTPEERLRNNRLPNNLIPYAYSLEIIPDIYNFTGRGDVVDINVEIYIECHQATDSIVLNLANQDLSFESVTLFVAPDSSINPPVPQVIGINLDANRELLFISLNFNLTAGAQYRLIMRTSFELTAERNGLFLFYYEYGGQMRKNVGSKFIPDYARHMFPCYDEPEYKARFSITILRRQGYRSVSNMAIERTEQRPNGWFADVYEESIRIATHGLSVFVLDFASSEYSRNGVRYRVFYRPNSGGSPIVVSRFAPDIVQFYENFTAFNYPLNKLDVIALPGFGGGSNGAGVITWGENSILFNSYNFNTITFIQITATIAQGIARQWFGQVVTPYWWHDQWISEALCGYFRYTAMDWSLPQLWNGAELHEFFDVILSLEFDSLNDSYPLMRESINGLDAKSIYFPTELRLKGPPLLRMFEHAMTPPTFKRAIQRYLFTYRTNVASTDDFVQVLQNQVDDDNIFEPDDITPLNMTNKFASWVLQAYYPIVHVNRSTATGGDMIVTQDKFISPQTDEARPGAPYGYMWNIPVSLYSEDFQEIDTSTRFWIDRQQEYRIPNNVMPPEQKLMMLNVNRTGYYRVEYENVLHQKIQEDLETGTSPIPYQMKAQLIDDAFEIAQSRSETEERAMNLTKFLKFEDTFLVWAAVAREFVNFELQLSRAIYYGDMQAYWLLHINPVHERLGLNDPNPSIRDLSITDRLLRILIKAWACAYHNPNCTAIAQADFQRWREQPFLRLSPDTDWITMCTVIRAGGSDEWDFVYTQLANRRLLPDGVLRWFLALSCSREPWLNQRFLERCLSGEMNPFASLFLAFNDIGRELVWSHLKDDWISTGLGTLKNPLLVFVFLGFHDPSDILELEQHIADHPANSTAEMCAYYFARNIVQYNVGWHQRTQTWLPEWLEKNVFRPIPGNIPTQKTHGAGAGVGGINMWFVLQTVESAMAGGPIVPPPAPPSMFEDLRDICTLEVLFGFDLFG